MSVQQASSVEQDTMSLVQRLALVPKEERIRPHDEFEAISTISGQFLPDPLVRVVFGYFLATYEIEPKELIGRVCLTPPRVPFEMHYFFLRTDNILPLFNRMIKFGEEFGCREVMIETIKTASLTNYTCVAPKKKYPPGPDADFRSSWKHFVRDRDGMEVWELNLGMYVREKVEIHERAARFHPDRSSEPNFPYPNLPQIHALLNQEKIPMMKSDLLRGFLMGVGAGDDDKLALEIPTSKVSFAPEDVHLYEADDPIADGMGELEGDCWHEARLTIRTWDDCCLRYFAELCVCFAEAICWFFCGERGEDA